MLLGSSVSSLFLAETLPIAILSCRVPICRLLTRSLHNLLHRRQPAGPRAFLAHGAPPWCWGAGVRIGVAPALETKTAPKENAMEFHFTGRALIPMLRSKRAVVAPLALLR
jgi:hypothetical protein